MGPAHRINPRRRKNVAQGSLSSPSADGRLLHRAVVLTARPGGIQFTMFAVLPVRIRITLLAGRQEPPSLEKPQGRTAGPALPGWTPMSARPFAVGGRLAVPSVYIAAEPGRVGQALPLPGDRVAQGGKLQAQRLQFERRLRLCDPEVAQGSLSSLAALPPRRGLGGAARENSDYLVCGAARTRTAGKAAGPESGPCATRPNPDVRTTFRSRGTACRPLRVHCRRTRKGRASPTPTW